MVSRWGVVKGAKAELKEGAPVAAGVRIPPELSDPAPETVWSAVKTYRSLVSAAADQGLVAQEKVKRFCLRPTLSELTLVLCRYKSSEQPK